MGPWGIGDVAQGLPRQAVARTGKKHCGKPSRAAQTCCQPAALPEQHRSAIMMGQTPTSQNFSFGEGHKERGSKSIQVVKVLLEKVVA